MKINFNDINLLISDVDGVLTDGTIYLGNDGIELKKFNPILKKYTIHKEIK